MTWERGNQEEKQRQPRQGGSRVEEGLSGEDEAVMRGQQERLLKSYGAS